MIVKKLFLFITLLFTITLANAQMIVTNIEQPKRVGKVRVMGLWFGRLEKYSDENFLLSYLDYRANENQIQEWNSLVINSIDVDKLYNLITENFKKMPNEDVKVELPNDILFIRYKFFFGIRYVIMYHAVAKNLSNMGIMRPFRKKQISKLFGKNK